MKNNNLIEMMRRPIFKVPFIILMGFIFTFGFKIYAVFLQDDAASIVQTDSLIKQDHYKLSNHNCFFPSLKQLVVDTKNLEKKIEVKPETFLLTSLTCLSTDNFSNVSDCWYFRNSAEVFENVTARAYLVRYCGLLI
jgi:hypothetical protein